MIRRSRFAALATMVAVMALLALALPASAGAPAAQFFVDEDGVVGPGGCETTGSTAYQTIQDAVDAVTLNKTRIYVCPGTYLGRVEIDEEDGTVIRAVDPWTATLMPAADHFDTASMIGIFDVEDTKIVGLNIVTPTEPCDTTVGAAIRVEDAPHTILRSNHIRAPGSNTLNTACGYERGIDMNDSPGSLIAWNRVIDFRFRGIGVDTSNGVRVRGNTVRFNHGQEGVVDDDTIGIFLNNSAQARVLRNVVGGLTTAGDTTSILERGILIQQSNGTHVRDNHVFRVGFGIQTQNSRTLAISGNNVRHAHDAGIDLHNTSSSSVENNSVKAGQAGGIVVHSTSTGNGIVGNDFGNNLGTDCTDLSLGPANTWTNNLGSESIPAGICSAP
jgi:Periplasmic copper-binding protein (NosD)